MRPSRRRLLRRVLTALVLLALSLVLVAGRAADHLILGRNREAIDPGPLRRERVAYGDQTAECWVARSPGAASREPEAFVLFFVGKTDRADRWTDDVAAAWGDRPVEVWGVNYPGSGGSTGPPRLARVTPAALAAYDRIRQHANGRPVFAQAASFGTTAALAVAARRPVAGMVLMNPPPLRQLILGQHGWWNLWLLAGVAARRVPPDLDSLANAARSNGPAVFVLHGADEVIPPKYQHRVVAAYAGPKRLIKMPGARHADALSKEASAELAAASDWLWAQAVGGPGP